jgi:cell division protein FtsW
MRKGNHLQTQSNRPFIYDKWILMTVLALLAIGIVMVGSASMVISDRHYHTPFYFLAKYLAFVCVGIALGWGVTRISLNFWQEKSLYILLIGIFFLVIVLIPGIGRTVNGSRRWINFGFLTFQVSEFIKFAIILYLARYLTRFNREIETSMSVFLRPIIIVALLAFLLLLEPDFGALVVIGMVVFAMLFLANVRLWPFILLALLALLSLGVLAWMAPYRLARLTSVWHPWQDPFGSGYQLTQSLIAFGRGGLWGVGLGNSIQKLFYLPEAYTDFIFAVLGEEFGLLGCSIVLGLFLLLVFRVFFIVRQAFAVRNLFAAYLAFGLGFWLGLQSLINMSVSVGLLPTKGLTLPFMSYGGSSMLISCMVAGLLLRIAYESTWV